MSTRTAGCNCDQLKVTCDGEPIRVSVCHCLACQKRTGSAFGVQARFAEDRVRIEGEYKTYVRVSDEGEERTFGFCPECGATVVYWLPVFPGTVAVPVGAFADPGFPAPVREIYEDRRHPWVALQI